MRGTVIIFAKEPVAGRVKTRLGAEIGMGRAASLFRIMMNRTIAEAEKGDWRLILAVDPPSAVSNTCRAFPAHLKRMPQGRGDLGARMGRVFAKAPPGPVLIIGADAPSLRARHLQAAFNALRSVDVVFGPADDGGYWLMGLARRRAEPVMASNLFAGVRWSTNTAMNDTIASLPPHYHIEMLETLGDVDEKKDLKKLRPAALAR